MKKERIQQLVRRELLKETPLKGYVANKLTNHFTTEINQKLREAKDNLAKEYAQIILDFLKKTIEGKRIEYMDANRENRQNGRILEVVKASVVFEDWTATRTSWKAIVESEKTGEKESVPGVFITSFLDKD
jgi:hypothetical protein